MNREDYVSYLMSEVAEYNSRVSNHVLKLFKADANIDIIDDEQLSIENYDGIDITKENTLHNKIHKILSKSDRAIEIFESWEFNKDYKYSSVFESDRFDELCEAIKNKSENIICEQDSLYEFLSKDIIPVIRIEENKIVLKFNFKTDSFNYSNGSEELIKHTVLVVIHKTEKLIEIRFDTIYSPYSRNNNHYFDLIEFIKHYISREYSIDIFPLSLEHIKTDLSNEDSDIIKITCQEMELINGGRAKLDAGKNENYMIPIIGDLKVIISEHQSELEKAPALKAALEEFIYENEEMSDYTSIVITWINQIKTRNISIKIVFKYRNSDYNLIQHYSNTLIGTERMDHVISYIGEHKHPTEQQDSTS